MPFEIPVSWKWCKVDDFAYVASGSTPDKSAFVEKGIPYLKMYNLKNQKIDFDFKPQYIKEEVHNGKLQRSRTEVGDLIMNIVGPPLGKLAIIPSSLPQCNFNQAAVLIRPIVHKEIIVNFLYYYLSEMSEINSLQTRGNAGQDNISLTQCMGVHVPMPPLNEQKRIVAEIEKWFALINDLETDKQELQEAIKKSKMKILDLAIHGKLVEQDPNDEPASELLKHIAPNAALCDNSHYPNLLFEIPDNWVWVKLGDISDYGKCQNVSVEKIGQEEWVLELEDIEKDTARIIQFKTKSDREIKGTRHKFSKGCVLYSKLRTYLNKVLVPDKDGFCTTEIIPINFAANIDSDYLCSVLRSQYFMDYTNQKGYGVKMPRLSTTDAKNGFIPLPPFAEQKRIVKTIEDTFAVLDAIIQEL